MTNKTLQELQEERNQCYKQWRNEVISGLTELDQLREELIVKGKYDQYVKGIPVGAPLLVDYSRDFVKEYEHKPGEDLQYIVETDRLYKIAGKIKRERPEANAFISSEPITIDEQIFETKMSCGYLSTQRRYIGYIEAVQAYKTKPKCCKEEN